VCDVTASSALVEPTNRLAEREALLDIPNVYSYQVFIDSDKAGYLIRQWVASNLYDRIRWVVLRMRSFGCNTCPTVRVLF